MFTHHNVTQPFTVVWPFTISHLRFDHIVICASHIPLYYINTLTFSARIWMKLMPSICCLFLFHVPFIYLFILLSFQFVDVDAPSSRRRVYTVVTHNTQLKYENVVDLAFVILFFSSSLSPSVCVCNNAVYILFYGTQIYWRMGVTNTIRHHLAFRPCRLCRHSEVWTYVIASDGSKAVQRLGGTKPKKQK